MISKKKEIGCSTYIDLPAEDSNLSFLKADAEILQSDVMPLDHGECNHQVMAVV